MSKGLWGSACAVALLTTLWCRRHRRSTSIIESMEPGKLSGVTTSPAGVDHMIFLPADWKVNGPKHPVVLFLHGAGGVKKPSGVTSISLGNMVGGGKPNPYNDPGLKVDSEDENMEFAASFPCITIFPVASQRGWQTQFPGLIQLVDSVLSDLNGDPSRVYLTGQSMGGNGGWKLGMENPDRFAAMAIFCGGYDIDPAEAAETLKTMPIWTFHAEDDGMVPVTGTDAIVEALKAAGSEIKYTRYPAGKVEGMGGHGSWEHALKDPELFNWLLSHSM